VNATRLRSPDPEAALFDSIEPSPIASVISDWRIPDNPIVAVNAAFTRLTGYTREESVGRNCRFLQGPDSEEDARTILRTATAQGRPALVELTNYRKDGTPFRNAVMIAPLLGPNGEVAYYLGSQMEVNAQTGTLDNLRQRRAAEVIRVLTPRQRQVLEQMIRGLRNKQIAASLGIDEKTVKMHRAGLLVKLGASTSADAIRMGVEAGI
jgi:PAS domain S-box-containing protein